MLIELRLDAPILNASHVHFMMSISQYAFRSMSPTLFSDAAI